MSKEYRDDEYEKICYICRRPESKTGKMIVMPGNICVCPDCMQKTFDTVNAGYRMEFLRIWEEKQMKRYLDLVPISVKIHRKQSRRTKNCRRTKLRQLLKEKTLRRYRRRKRRKRRILVE